MILQCGPKAPQAQPAGVMAGVAGNEADPRMTQLDEMFRHLPGRALVIHVHERRSMVGAGRRDAHEG